VGQTEVNLSEKAGNTAMYNIWSYVIRHFGHDWGETCGAIFGNLGDSNPELLPRVDCGDDANSFSGIMRFNRRFDDSSIESQAVGAIPFNFQPDAAPLPKSTSPFPNSTPMPPGGNNN
jgi:hypothetical protein